MVPSVLHFYDLPQFFYSAISRHYSSPNLFSPPCPSQEGDSGKSPTIAVCFLTLSPLSTLTCHPACSVCPTINSRGKANKPVFGWFVSPPKHIGANWYKFLKLHEHLKTPYSLISICTLTLQNTGSLYPVRSKLKRIIFYPSILQFVSRRRSLGTPNIHPLPLLKKFFKGLPAKAKITFDKFPKFGLVG